MRRSTAGKWAFSVLILIVGSVTLWKHCRIPVYLRADDENSYSVQQAYIYSQLRTSKMYRGNPTRKWIALTFDDGPHPYHTPMVTVKVLPDFVREMRRQGYEFVTIEQMWKDMWTSIPQTARYEREGFPSPFFGGS